MSEKSNRKKKVTLLLDDKSIDIIKAFGSTFIGSTSMSASIRAMTREYEQRTSNQKQNS